MLAQGRQSSRDLVARSEPQEELFTLYVNDRNQGNVRKTYGQL